MSDPPAAKKSKDSSTITMLIDEFTVVVDGKQCSPIERIKGLPWQLEVALCREIELCGELELCDEVGQVSLHCLAHMESELWRAKTKIQMCYTSVLGAEEVSPQVSHKFASWMPDSHLFTFPTRVQLSPNKKRELRVEIQVESEGESFARRASVEFVVSAHDDATILVGGKKYRVNKQVLAAQSSYFNGLFYGSFKESNQEEIEIKDTDPEDFHELIKMMHGVSTVELKVKNCMRYLKMADRFDLKIVKDRMENFLLYTNKLSIDFKLLDSERHKLKMLQSEVLLLYNKEKIGKLMDTPMFDELSPDMVKKLLRVSADQNYISYQSEGRMSDPPAFKRSRDSSTITMLVDEFTVVADRKQLSAVERVSGLPWRLEVALCDKDALIGPNPLLYDYGQVSVQCMAHDESELWRAKAELKMTYTLVQGEEPVMPQVHTFASWKPDSHLFTFPTRVKLSPNEKRELRVEIQVESEGERFARRASTKKLLFVSEHDASIIVGGEKIRVNKQVLSAQSSYFNSLFNSDFKESKQEEIEIKGTNPEDFHELIKIIHGISTDDMTEANYMRYLMMADKFYLRIVRDRMENFLLSAKKIPIHRKLLISEQHKLQILQSEVLLLYNKENVKDLMDSRMVDLLSPDMVKKILRISVDQN